jgi:hypothetical protein
MLSDQLEGHPTMYEHDCLTVVEERQQLAVFEPLLDRVQYDIEQLTEEERLVLWAWFSKKVQRAS